MTSASQKEASQQLTLAEVSTEWDFLLFRYNSFPEEVRRKIAQVADEQQVSLWEAYNWLAMQENDEHYENTRFG